MLYLIDEIHQASDCTKSFEVRAVLLDISKAFDKLWHKGLIFKMERNGISGSLLKLFHNYLIINDLENIIKSNIKFFADDTMLFSLVKDPHMSASDLNHDLDIIKISVNQWKMEFNPDPLKQATEVLFLCKKNNTNYPQIFFNGTVDTKVKEQKDLGLILESNLSFSKHLSEKIKKAKQNIGLIN